MTEERAVLAGGCFWGMQDLIRRYDGRDLDAGRLLGRRRAERDLSQPRHPCRSDRDRLRSGPAQLSQAARVLLPDARPDHAQSPGQRRRAPATARRSSTRATSRSAVAEDTIADVDASGLWPGKVVTEVAPAASSGRPSPSTRTIWSASRTATPAISCGRAGSSRHEATAGEASRFPLPSAGQKKRENHAAPLRKVDGPVTQRSADAGGGRRQRRVAVACNARGNARCVGLTELEKYPQAIARPNRELGRDPQGGAGFAELHCNASR